MRCPYQSRLKDYLDERLPEEQIKEVEEHIEDCMICQEELERLIDQPLELPKQRIDIADEVLVSKIQARRKGKRRILCYGIAGFVLGLFSRFYTSDSFIVTKAIMALPYKLGEFALGIFFSKNRLPAWNEQRILDPSGLGFFPFHPVLDFLAETITPAIIASFIAIMLGYLASDSRVFQRKKLIRFLILGLLVFIVWSGVLQGVYTYALTQIEKLEDIREVTVYILEKNSISWLIQIDETASTNQKYAVLLEELSRSEKTDIPFSHANADMKLLFRFGRGGQIEGNVILGEGVLWLQNGDTYRLSAEVITGLQELMEGERNEQNE